MFTPYGYHGLGDSARIPISFTKEISNINWTKYAQLDNISFFIEIFKISSTSA